jgi:hypothetical protein
VDVQSTTITEGSRFTCSKERWRNPEGGDSGDAACAAVYVIYNITKRADIQVKTNIGALFFCTFLPAEKGCEKGALCRLFSFFSR